MQKNMQKVTKTSLWSLRLSVLAIALAFISVGAFRLDLLDFRLSLLGMVGAVFVALSGIMLSLICLFGSRQTHIGAARHSPFRAITALVLGLGYIALPLNSVVQGYDKPLIHDISTDLENPPQFVAIEKMRAPTDNPLALKPDFMEAQKKAYPDIGPLMLPLSPQETFDKAMININAMGWEVMAAARAEGRIEATATTALFGFRDDVMVRIVPAEGGSRLDMRSVSRVGKSDLGANAERIRQFLDMF